MAFEKKCDLCGNLYENYNAFFDPKMEDGNRLDPDVNGVAFVKANWELITYQSFQNF